MFLVLVLIVIIKDRCNKNTTELDENKRVDVVMYVTILILYTCTIVVLLYSATIKASVILLPLLGITWVIGLFAVNQETSFFTWSFVILNTFQVNY